MPKPGSVSVVVLRADGIKKVSGRRRQTPYVQWTLSGHSGGATGLRQKKLGDGASDVASGGKDDAPEWDEEELGPLAAPPDMMLRARGGRTGPTAPKLSLELAVFDHKFTKDKLVGFAQVDLLGLAAQVGNGVSTVRQFDLSTGGCITARLEFTGFPEPGTVSAPRRKSAAVGRRLRGRSEAAQELQAAAAAAAAAKAEADAHPVSLAITLLRGRGLPRVVTGRHVQTAVVVWWLVATAPGDDEVVLANGTSQVARNSETDPEWGELLGGVDAGVKAGGRPGSGRSVKLLLAVRDHKLFRESEIGECVLENIQELEDGTHEVTLDVHGGGQLVLQVKVAGYRARTPKPAASRRRASSAAARRASVAGRRLLASSLGPDTGAGGGAGAGGGGGSGVGDDSAVAWKPMRDQYGRRYYAQGNTAVWELPPGAVVGPSPEELLPGDWQERTDTAGNAYYYSPSKARSSWTVPRATAAATAADDDWVEQLDSAGRTYYWSESRQRSSWTRGL